MSRLTHQVIGFVIGDRSTTTLKELWRCVPACYRRKLVYTDRYESYAEHFKKWQHRSGSTEVAAPKWQHRPCEKGSGKTSVIEGLNNNRRIEQQMEKPRGGFGAQNRVCAASR